MKFVLELEDEPLVRKSALHGETAVYKAKGFNSLVFDQNGIDKLEPYKEQNGEEVWEIARKIALEHNGGYSIKELREMFGDNFWVDDVFNLPLSKVISKIREYEAKKKEEFHVGDEVRVDLYGQDRLGIVKKIDLGNRVVWIFGKDFSGYFNADSLTKTGKSYPEVAKAISELEES